MADEKAPEEEGAKKKGKLGIIIPALVLLIGLGGAGFFFLSGGKEAAADPNAPTTTTTLAHGPIIRLDQITLNLADGHVLKVGVALEMLAEPEDEQLAAIVAAMSGGGVHGAAPAANPSPMGGLEAKALDITIKELGDMTFEELSKPGGRTEAKEELSKEISHAYHDDVVEIFFTTFVMS